MDFKVGDAVIITDGKKRAVSVIEGFVKGYLKVGAYFFDWTGKEVNAVYPQYRIYPLGAQ